MSKSGLAIEPRLVLESLEEAQALQAQGEELWSQESIVHARAEKIRPEYHRERLQELAPGMDIKRLML